MIDCHPKNLPASPGCRLTQNVGEDPLEDVPMCHIERQLEAYYI